MLAVVLVAGGLGGLAYAQVNGHEPMTGQKLVGMGYFGEHYDEESGETFQLHTMFSFTNPDGVSEITIDRVSILDQYGAVLYEGLLKPWTEERIMMPHEVDAVELHDYLEPGDLIPVTVEIFWSGSHKEGLPLIGWQLTSIGFQDAEGNPIEMTSSESQMVNMEQVLVPKVEKEVTTLRLQTWFQPDDPLMEPLENFAQAVAERSGGSVQVELYPEASPWEIAEAVRRGEVEMGLIFTGGLRDYSRVMDASELPFLYNDDDGLMAAVQAGIGDLMTEEMKAHNITALDWTTTGFSHLFSREVMLDEPGDLTWDVKIRVPNLPIRGEAISQWGGTPITMASREMYMALKDGLIHGATFPLDGYYQLKLYEVAPYFCVDYAFASLAGLCINSKVWKSLDENTQQIIAKAAGDYVDEMLETVKLVDAEALERINGYEGVTVYTLTPEERAIWRQASQPVWEWWLEELGDARPVGEEIIAIALEHNPLPAPPKTLRLQTWFGPDEPFMQPLENFANTVNSQSDLVRIKVYPGSALVPNPELAEAVRQGTVEMGLIYSVFLQDSPSLMDAPQLPFLYNNEDGLMAAVEAGIGDLMSEALQEPNITVLTWTTTGFSHLYNRLVMADDQVVLDHPIIHPDDVAGLKIRSMNISAEAITEWLGHSVFIPWGAELYQALAGGVIDGAIHSPSTYEMMNFYEVAPYFCVDYFFGELTGLCINSDVWDSLDAKTQDDIAKAAGDYVDEMLETVKLVDAEALERINGYEGVTVYTLTPEERAIWRAASQPVWDRWVQEVGPVGQQIIDDIALPLNPLPEIP